MFDEESFPELRGKETESRDLMSAYNSILDASSAEFTDLQ